MENLSEKKIWAMQPNRFVTLLYGKAQDVKSDFPNLSTQEEILNILKIKEGGDLTDLSRIYELKSVLPTEDIHQWMSFMVALERWQGIHLKDQDFLQLQESDDLDKEVEKTELVIVLDNIRSSFNVGSILRTAECFGAKSVICTGYTSTPDNGKTAKSTMGVEKYIHWEHNESIIDAIKSLKDSGYKVVAIEKSAKASSVFGTQLAGKTALVLGNEEFGISEEVLTSVDEVIQIPLVGKKNSLNVANAASIMIYEYSRQRG